MQGIGARVKVGRKPKPPNEEGEPADQSAPMAHQEAQQKSEWQTDQGRGAIVVATGGHGSAAQRIGFSVPCSGRISS